MPDKAYLVRFNPPEISAQHMTAASTDVYGDHLVFLNSKEEPVGIFLLDTVESWTVTNLSKYAPEHAADSLAPVFPAHPSAEQPKNMRAPWDHGSPCV